MQVLRGQPGMCAIICDVGSLYHGCNYKNIICCISQALCPASCMSCSLRRDANVIVRIWLCRRREKRHSQPAGSVHQTLHGQALQSSNMLADTLSDVTGVQLIVPANSQATHACAALFLVPGLYKLSMHAVHARAANEVAANAGNVETLSVCVSPLHVLVS